MKCIWVVYTIHLPQIWYIWLVLSWWCHQMETCSAPVNSPHKGQWRGALMFYLICAWINDWVNNGEAGYLIRHRAHYGVIVMLNMGAWHLSPPCWLLHRVRIDSWSSTTLNLWEKLTSSKTGMGRSHVYFFHDLLSSPSAMTIDSRFSG